MKPVMATVMVILHFFDGDQFRGFRGEVAKLSRSCAALWAVVCLVRGRNGGGGGVWWFVSAFGLARSGGHGIDSTSITGFADDGDIPSRPMCVVPASRMILLSH